MKPLESYRLTSITMDGDKEWPDVSLPVSQALPGPFLRPVGPVIMAGQRANWHQGSYSFDESGSYLGSLSAVCGNQIAAADGVDMLTE